MNAKMFFLSVSLFLLFFSAASITNAQKTTVKIAAVSELENNILAEINFIRTQPAEYAAILKEMRKYYQGTILTAPGRIGLRTTEGVSALDEAISVLEKTRPSDALEAVCAGIRASRDHLADLQQSGAFSHFGSDGSSPQERLKKYLNGNFYSGENITGRKGNAREIVMTMIIDDGVSDRIHQKNLLNPLFKFAGISNGDNDKKMNLTVVVLSDSSAEIEVCEMKN